MLQSWLEKIAADQVVLGKTLETHPTEKKRSKKEQSRAKSPKLSVLDAHLYAYLALLL